MHGLCVLAYTHTVAAPSGAKNRFCCQPQPCTLHFYYRLPGNVGMGNWEIWELDEEIGEMEDFEL